MTFGKYLKRIRKGIMSQRELAEKVGVGYPYISKLENDVEPPPSDDLLIKLSEALSVDAEEVFSMANRLPPNVREYLIQDISVVKVVEKLKKDLLMKFLVNHYDEILEDNENLFWYFFNINKKTMLLVDPETLQIVNANDAATIFYNYSKSELMNMKISEINTLPEEEIIQEIKKAKLQERNFFNFRHKLNNDIIVDVKVKSSPIILDKRIYLCSVIEAV